MFDRITISDLVQKESDVYKSQVILIIKKDMCENNYHRE